MRTSTIEERFADLLEAPTADHCWAVRECVLDRADYDPYAAHWQQLAESFRLGDYSTVLEGVALLGAVGLLSPRVHFFAGVAAAELGDHQRAAEERLAMQACLRGLLELGAGTSECPFVVTYLWDVYDLLQTLGVQPLGQRLVDLGDIRCDVLRGDDGQDYWFDVTDLLVRRPATVVASGK